jgi:CHAT domain-containing protein/tetratricopeptide (TPR) repeat protein
VDERADTHQAGLDRHVHHGAGEPVVVCRSSRSAQRHDLGVGRGVHRVDWLVESAPDDLSGEDHHRANRDLARGLGVPRFLEREAHEGVVIRHGSIIQAGLEIPQARRENEPDMPTRVVACLVVSLVPATVAPARAADPFLSPPLALVHGLLDAHDVPASRRAIAALDGHQLSSADRLALDAARGRLALLTYDLPHSRETLTAMVAEADAAGTRVLAARGRIWLAQTLVGLADIDGAKAVTQPAHDVLVAEHDLRGEFSALQLLSTFSTAGRRTLMERQLQIARDLHDASLEARVRNRWAATLLGGGRFGAGLAEAEHAEQMARSDARQAGWLISHALGLKAWALRGHGEFAKPLAINREGVRSAMAYGDYESAAWNWVGAGDSLDGMARTEAMADAMRQGLAIARRTGMPALIHSLIASVALSQFQVHRWASAARLYEEALAKPLGDSPVYAMIRLAGCRRQLGDPAAALVVVDNAIAAARDRADPNGETQALAERAETLQALGREEEARRSLADCLERLEAMRRDLSPSDALKRGFGDVHDDYALAVDVLERQGREAEALAAAEQARARALADLLLARRSAEQQPARDEDSGAWRLGQPERAQPAAVSDSVPEPPADSAFRRSIAAPALDATALAALARRLDSTLLVYWVHDRGSYVWAVTGDGSVHGARVPLTKWSIDGLVHTATSSWPSVAVRGVVPPPSTASAGSTKPDARDPLARLYAGLISPVERWLPGPGSRLTIIPHGSLFQLSFAALVDPHRQYLIERYAIAYAPGGAALADALTPHADRPAPRGALLVADPLHPRGPDGAALPQLAGARAEVRLVSRMLAGGRDADAVLVGDAATEAAVRAAATDARVIHFAAHAIAAERAERDPYIALAAPRTPQPDSRADGRLTASEIYDLPLSADLVVLSACRSARGTISSDGIAGLSRAFIAAGAPSVVASLWDAADQPTAILMKTFYRRYAAGEPKDRALRDAQLGLLRELRAGRVTVETSGGRTALPEHPMFWAGFVVEGRP